MTDLEKTILEHLPAALFQRAAKSSKTYHDAFRVSGREKADNALQILKKLRPELSRCAYMSVGGSFGSEITSVMDRSDIRHGVLLEYDPAVVSEVTIEVERLRRAKKELVYVPGDATQQIDACRRVIEEWVKTDRIDTVVFSAQAVFHELPTRSPNFHLSTFLHKLLSGWPRAIFICREPCAPREWPPRVELSIPEIQPKIVEELAKEIARRLDFPDQPIRRTGDFVEMTGSLGVETLFKIYYASDMQHELQERITTIEPNTFLLELEEQLGRGSVSRTFRNSGSFDRHYQELRVQARDPKTKAGLPRPLVFCEFVGDSSPETGAVRPAKTRRRASTASARERFVRDGSSDTPRFLRRRCRTMPPGSPQFGTIVRALLSHQFEQNVAKEQFQQSWRTLPTGYEREMAHAAFLESLADIEQMRDVLSMSAFPEPAKNSARRLYLALAHEKLDEIPRAKEILWGILETESEPEILRAAQFNLHVCYEKDGDLGKADFTIFIEENDIAFIDGERLSDKAVAMQLILCIREHKAFAYERQLQESLDFLLGASKTGYAKTLLMRMDYLQSELTPEMIDTILSQTHVMDANSRIAVLVTLLKYLPKNAKAARKYIDELLHAHRGQSTTVKKWLVD